MAFRRLFPFDVVADGAVTGSPVAPQINLAPQTQNIFFGIDDSGNLWVNDAQVGTQTATVTLTNAEILAAFNGTSEFELVPSPGAGKAFFVLGGLLQLHIVGTYGGVSATDSFVGLNVGPNIVTSGLLNDKCNHNFQAVTGDRVVLLGIRGQLNVGANEVLATYAPTSGIDGIEDQPLQLQLYSGDAPVTLGNSANTVKVTVYYTVVDLS